MQTQWDATAQRNGTTQQRVALQGVCTHSQTAKPGGTGDDPNLGCAEGQAGLTEGWLPLTLCHFISTDTLTSVDTWVSHGHTSVPLR